jgi:hypothetical protein
MINRPYAILTALVSAPLIFSASLTFASIDFPEESANDPYHVGKITYHRKLACPDCPLSKTIIDASMYKSIVERLNTDKELMTLLNGKERTAVSYYLETLFTPRR